MVNIEKLIKEDVEFCNVETGERFKAYGKTVENEKTTVLLEPVHKEEF